MKKIIGLIGLWILSILSFLSLPVHAEDTFRSVITRVYSETNYEYTFRVTLPWPGERAGSVTHAGAASGFAIRHNGQLFILTSAHVISGPAKPDRMTDPKADRVVARNQITSSKFRVRVSELSFRPDHILVDAASDLAILTLPDGAEEVLRLHEFELATSRPSVRDIASIWGFPGTGHQQMKEGFRITDLQSNFFVINESLEPGFSGGPVVDKNQFLLGVASRSTANQARVSNLNAIRNLLGRFDAESVPYVDGMRPLH